MQKIIFAMILNIAIVFANECLADVNPVTMLSIKSETKIPSVLVCTQTADNVVDVGGLFRQQYYRVMLNRLKANVAQAGIAIDELQLKLDELSIDPKGDAKKAIIAKSPQYTLFVDVVRVSRIQNAFNYSIQVVLTNSKAEKNLYEGTFFVNQRLDSASPEKMNELGDKIFSELKDALGLGLPSPPLPSMDAVTKDRCLTLARKMADNIKIMPAEIRSISKELSDTCPRVSYDCVTYVGKPENNSCSIVPLDPKSGILKNRTYN